MLYLHRYLCVLFAYVNVMDKYDFYYCWSEIGSGHFSWKLSSVAKSTVLSLWLFEVPKECKYLTHLKGCGKHYPQIICSTSSMVWSHYCMLCIVLVPQLSAQHMIVFPVIFSFILNCMCTFLPIFTVWTFQLRSPLPILKDDTVHGLSRKIRAASRMIW